MSISEHLKYAEARIAELEALLDRNRTGYLEAMQEVGEQQARIADLERAHQRMRELDRASEHRIAELEAEVERPKWPSIEDCDDSRTCCVHSERELEATDGGS